MKLNIEHKSKYSMKDIFFKSIFPFLGIVITMTSCVRPCEDLWGLEKSTMVIYPFSIASDNYVYLEDGKPSLFERDSLKIINEDGRQFPLVSFLLKSDPRNTLNGFYAIKLEPSFIIPDDNDAFSAERTRNIYIYYNYNAIDTLSLVFKAKTGKCDRSRYDYLKVYYKKQMIASVSDDISIDFTLNR